MPSNNRLQRSCSTCFARTIVDETRKAFIDSKDLNSGFLGGHEARFSWVLLLPLVAPLNVSVRLPSTGNRKLEARTN